MARRGGGSHKCVEEKRRMLPIYQHYTLSPGRTKSHHPEAKCVHCLKEFVCGSKQRLIRHLRKCNSISNPEQIIAETLNTLARHSATGQLNHSILEASNLLPSQISHIHSTSQQFVGHAIHPQQQYHHHPHQHLPTHNPNNNHPSSTSSSNSTLTTTTSNINNNNGANGSNESNINGVINHNTSGSSMATSDTIILAATSNGSTSGTTFNGLIPVKKTRRGRRPSNQPGNGSGIHVTTGIDGKTQFTPISQLPPGIIPSSPQLITPLHNGVRAGNAYAAYQQTTPSCGAPSAVTSAATSVPVVPPGTALSSGHHLHHITPFKLNTEPIDKAYLKLVLTRNLPLSLCDTKEFQNWVKSFANDYKPPSSINLITQNLKQEAQSARQRVFNILVKAPKKTVNLELHCWPNRMRGCIWYSMIAALDNRRFLITIKDILGSWNLNNNLTTGDNGTREGAKQLYDNKTLTDFIDDCIKRVGSDRVNSLQFTGNMTSELTIVTGTRHALYSNHPSIVTYYCWWHFTNLLGSDVIELDEKFRGLLRKSNILVNFISKRSHLHMKLEKFNPFDSATGTLNLKRDYSRWYSHLVCYLLGYIKNNHEAIMKALDEYYPFAEITQKLSMVSDSNNNDNSTGGIQQINNNISGNNIDNGDSDLSSTQPKQGSDQLQSDQSHLIEVRSIVTSTDFWTNLNSALVYLKPFRDIVALVSASPTSELPDCMQTTPAIPTSFLNQLSLSDYMHWFLNYGKSLIESWTQSPDNYKYDLIGRYVRHFNAYSSSFKLLFAAYLLNPKYRCAYVTQKAKDLAIEEILNIASEFMPEESDGHTIFDQWKLYLVREEPYDMIYDDSRSSALDWWLSLPCAVSIRRVALRILRLKAYSSPRPECLFSQLYFYEDETKTSLNKASFDDLAILHYFYEHEDRQVCPAIGTVATNSNTFINFSNGLTDRSIAGQTHIEHLQHVNDPARYLPIDGLSTASDVASANEQFANDTLNLDDSSELRIFTDISDTYINTGRISSQLDGSTNSSMSLKSLPGFDQFSMYIDFNELGIQVVEEPIEKKRRKWTAKEILSKCQTSYNNNSGVANHNSASDK